MILCPEVSARRNPFVVTVLSPTKRAPFISSLEDVDRFHPTPRYSVVSDEANMPEAASQQASARSRDAGPVCA